jgi:ABC-type transport system substrate-binding protein
MNSNSLTRELLLKRSAKLGALLVAGGGLGSVGRGWPVASADAGVAAVVKGGTLIMAMPGEPKTMDPHMTTLDVNRGSIQVAVFDALIRVNSKLQFTPSLARSWDVSKDGKAITFNLQQGVKFHDGTPFDAKAVAWNINRMKAKKTGSPYGSRLEVITRVTVSDAHTVVFQISAPAAAVLNSLPEVSFLSPESVSKAAKFPVGTGPFKFAKWVTGDRFEVVKNPDYFRRGQPYLDRIVFKVIPDADARNSNLKAGSVHIDYNINPKDVKALRAAGLAIISSSPITGYEHLQINVKQPPMDDVRVRQAIAWSFDRKAFVNTFHEGLARPSSSVFVREQAEYLPGAETRYTYDLDKAKALLSEAGYSASKPLEFEIINPAGYPLLTAAATLFQAALGSLGHKVAVADIEIGAWIDRILTKPNFHATTDIVNVTGPDPIGLFSNEVLAPGHNISQYYSPSFVKTANAAAKERNPKKRTQLYKLLQGILLEDQPVVVLCDYPILHGASNKVKGFTLSGQGALNQFEKVYLA